MGGRGFYHKRWNPVSAFGRDQSPRGARENEKRPNYGVVDDVDDDDIVHNPKRVDKVVKKILGAMYFALSIKGARFAMGGNRIHHNSILANIVGDTKPGAKKREGIYHSKVKAIENGKPAWWQRYSLQELLRKIAKAGTVLAKQEFFTKRILKGKSLKTNISVLPNFRTSPKWISSSGILIRVLKTARLRILKPYRFGDRTSSNATVLKGSPDAVNWRTFSSG
jgi:hypothetical protein